VNNLAWTGFGAFCSWRNAPFLFRETPDRVPDPDRLLDYELKQIVVLSGILIVVDRVGLSLPVYECQPMARHLFKRR
jgi:hypothetical protein